MLKNTKFKSLNEQIAYYYKNGWRIKDIAEKTGLTVDAVKNRIKRMRKKEKISRWWK